MRFANYSENWFNVVIFSVLQIFFYHCKHWTDTSAARVAF